MKRIEKISIRLIKTALARKIIFKMPIKRPKTRRKCKGTKRGMKWLRSILRWPSKRTRLEVPRPKEKHQ